MSENTVTKTETKECSCGDKTVLIENGWMKYSPNFWVSNMCIETCPCFHYVKRPLDGVEREMGGECIWMKVKSLGYNNDSHFKEYENMEEEFSLFDD